MCVCVCVCVVSVAPELVVTVPSLDTSASSTTPDTVVGLSTFAVAVTSPCGPIESPKPVVMSPVPVADVTSPTPPTAVMSLAGHIALSTASSTPLSQTASSKLLSPLSPTASKKNYRPISNLSFLSKILEKVVRHKPLAHLQENNLCNPFQSAYRTGHSTETAILRVVNDLLNVMKTKSLFYSYWTFQLRLTLSITRFFFPVSKLSLASALQWFRSYLLDRNQCVDVNNSASSSSSVMFGVLRGSVLGPVLYTTPLSDFIANHSVNHQLFADDTQLQKSTLRLSLR